MRDGSTENLRQVVAGALLDFLSHLADRKDAVLIGAQYPSKPLIDEFHRFCILRNIDVRSVSLNTWYACAVSGKLS